MNEPMPGCTARQARDAGVEVPDDVPDCAVFKVDGIGDIIVTRDGKRVEFEAPYINPRWAWTITVNQPGFVDRIENTITFSPK